MTKVLVPVYRFGPYRLDPTRRILTRDGEPVPLAPKALDLLLALVENSGAVVDKSDLMRTVWRDTAVEEGSLSQTVFVLRKALGERPTEHRYIVTIPGVGYRFVAPVELERAGEEDLDRKTAERLPGTVRESPQSIAVLPFTALGSAASEEYLELGIADALITKLGSLRQVAVRPTTAVLKYHGQDPLTAAHELKVDAVLNGTIQRSADRLRVAVHVIRVADGVTLWAGHVDEKLTELFSLEDSIAEKVTQALMLSLSDEDRQRLAKHQTENTTAYQWYLKGRFFWNKRTEDGLKRGIACFEDAIAQDAHYAAAYVGVADCCNLLSAYGVLPPRDGYPRAKAAAVKALELDDRLAEAHTSLGYASLHFYWNWPEAEREFQRALNLNPNYATAHQWYGGLLAAFGRFEESLSEIRQALALDPLSLSINADVGWLSFFARRHDEAIAELQKTIDMDPYFALAHWLLGLNYEQKGRLDEALAAFQRAAALFQEAPFALTSLAHVLAQSEKRDEALRVLDMVLQLSERRYVSAHSVATIYAALGQSRQAIEWLNRACDERSNWMIWLNVDARFDNLRAEAGFQAVLRRVGLGQGR